MTPDLEEKKRNFFGIPIFSSLLKRSSTKQKILIKILKGMIGN